MTSKLNTLSSILTEIEALDKAATPGPWRKVRQYWPEQGESFVVFHERGQQCSSDLNEHFAAATGPHESHADFIARSRTLLPKLARALREATEGLSDIAAANHINKEIPVALSALSRIDEIIDERP